MFYRENRYLLFLTENYAALQVLKRYLQEVVGLPAASSHASVGGAGGLEGPGDYMQAEKDRVRQEKNEQRKMEPFVLFGSSFPKDKEYTQVCVDALMCMCVYACVCMQSCVHMCLDWVKHFSACANSALSSFSGVNILTTIHATCMTKLFVLFCSAEDVESTNMNFFFCFEPLAKMAKF